MKVNPSKSGIVLGVRGRHTKDFIQQHIQGPTDKPCLVIGIGAAALRIPIKQSMTYLGIEISYANFEQETLVSRLRVAQATRCACPGCSVLDAISHSRSVCICTFSVLDLLRCMVWARLACNNLVYASYYSLRLDICEPLFDPCTSHQRIHSSSVSAPPIVYAGTANLEYSTTQAEDPCQQTTASQRMDTNPGG